MSQNDFYEGSFSAIGTPFDPYGREDECGVFNGRIMPFQFRYPIYPYAFTMIRNTASDDSDNTEASEM